MPKVAVIDSQEVAYERAVKMLARRPRTSTEVREQLIAAGASTDAVDEVVARLKAHRHLDDAELASDEAHTLLEGKGLSPELAMYKLTTRGIAPALARDCVEAVREGRSDWALCERALQRRLRGKRLPARNAGREGRALARLGYEEEIVARVIERAMNGSGE
jgi:regulatory protein